MRYGNSLVSQRLHDVYSFMQRMVLFWLELCSESPHDWCLAAWQDPDVQQPQMGTSDVYMFFAMQLSSAILSYPRLVVHFRFACHSETLAMGGPTAGGASCLGRN